MKRSNQNKFCDRRPVGDFIHNAACITQLSHSVFPLIQSSQCAQAQTRLLAFGEEKTVLSALLDTHFYMFLQFMVYKAKQTNKQTQSCVKEKKGNDTFWGVFCVKSAQHIFPGTITDSFIAQTVARMFSNVAATCKSKRSSLLFHKIFISNIFK